MAWESRAYQAAVLPNIDQIRTYGMAIDIISIAQLRLFCTRHEIYFSQTFKACHVIRLAVVRNLIGPMGVDSDEQKIHPGLLSTWAAPLLLPLALGSHCSQWLGHLTFEHLMMKGRSSFMVSSTKD